MNSETFKPLLLVIALGGILMTNTPTQAQTNDDAPTPNPVLEALERELAVAEARKAIAEAEKATRAAKLPDTESSGITGTSTFGEDSGYLAQVLAYRSLHQAAVAIAERLGSPGTAGREILVVAGTDLGRQAQLWEIANLRIEDAKLQLEALRTRYEIPFRGSEMAIAGTVTAASAILGAASDIASFFRTDLTVTSAAVEVTSASLLAEMAAALNGLRWTPVVPSMRLKRTTLLTNIEELQAERRRLAAHRDGLATSIQDALTTLATRRVEKTAADNDLKVAKAAKPPDAGAVSSAETRLQEIKTDIARLEVVEYNWKRAAAEIDAAVEAADALVKALVEGPEGKPSPVEAMVAVDLVKSDEGQMILQLEISSQGGEMHATKSAWTNRLTYLGAVAVTYLVTDHEGRVTSSGVVAIPIVRSSRVKDSPVNLVNP